MGWAEAPQDLQLASGGDTSLRLGIWKPGTPEGLRGVIVMRFAFDPSLFHWHSHAHHHSIDRTWYRLESRENEPRVGTQTRRQRGHRS